MGYLKHIKQINIFESNKHRVPVIHRNSFYEHIVTFRLSLESYFKIIKIK